jgi:DnaJ-class molecular chaperone
MNQVNKQSLYDVLGVNKQDSCNDIRKAYLKMAKTYHPDKGGDPEKFKEIVRASEVLTDEKKRQAYDNFGIVGDEQGGMPEGFSGMPSGGFPFPFDVNLNDFFGNMFGNPPVGPQRNQVRKGRKPAPSIQTMNISLEQFYLGHNRDIIINRNKFCSKCNNTGATVKETCKKCGGRGAISQNVQVGPMLMCTTGPCLDCQGKGEIVIEKCNDCSGNGFIPEKRVLSINILPGTKPNETYIFPEVCSDHPSFERPGDAHIIVSEDPSDSAFKVFKRCGDKLQHLETTLNISLSEALIGCTVKISNHPGYDNGLFVEIPPASFQGDKYTLSGAGMPIPGDIGKYGDLYINISVSIKSAERTLLASKGRELLTPHFEDKIRQTECNSDDVQKDIYLCNYYEKNR